MSESTKLEIVYGCDSGRAEELELSIKTVLKYNPDAHITVLSTTPLELSKGVSNIVLDLTPYGLPSAGRMGVATWLRLFIPKVMPTVDKVIYVDTDTVCQNSLKELWETPISYIGACPATSHSLMFVHELGIPFWFQAGVLVLNLKALRELDFTELGLFAAKHFLYPIYMCRFLDETLINVCFYNYIQELPLKWNLLVDRDYKYLYPKDIPTIDTACILHYAGCRPKELAERVALVLQ